MMGRRARGADERAWSHDPVTPTFAAKGKVDASRPNAGAVHLEAGLAVITYLAQADLASVSDAGDEDLPGDGRSRWWHRRRRRSRRGLSSWLAKPFRLLAIVGAGILGVYITERAFFVFGLPPTETRLVVIGVELMFVYAGHQVGSRLKDWKTVTGANRRVTLLVLVTAVSSIISVAVVRVVVLRQDNQGLRPDVALPLALAMFCSLALLLLAIAIDAGLAPARAADVEREEADRAIHRRRDQAVAARLRLRRDEVLQRWLACLHAYRQAYLGAVSPELMAEVELVKPPPIMVPMELSTYEQEG